MQIHSYGTPYSHVDVNCINAPIHSYTTRTIPAATPLHCYSFFSLFQAVLNRCVKAGKGSRVHSYTSTPLSLDFCYRGHACSHRCSVGGSPWIREACRDLNRLLHLHVHILGRALLVGLGNDGLLGC